MNRDTFIKMFSDQQPTVDKVYMDKVIEDSLSSATEDKFEGFMNLIIVNEEFSECQQEVSKVLRGKSDHIALLEETADAFLSIKYIQKICNISNEELNKAVNVKLAREAMRSKSNE